MRSPGRKLVDYIRTDMCPIKLPTEFDCIQLNIM